MACLRREKPDQNPIESRGKYSGSLARRVLLLCALLLIIPLILFALFLADIEKEIQQREQKIQLVLVGKALSTLIEKWIELKIENLKLLKALVEESQDLDSLFRKISQTSTAFLLENGRYRASNDLSLIGQTANLPKGQVEIAPLLQGRMPSFIIVQDSIGIAVDAAAWLETMARLQDEEIPFLLQITDRDGNVLIGKQRSLESSHSISLPGDQFRLLISFPTGTLKQEAGVRLINRLLKIFGLFLLLGIGAVFWLTQRMARPLRQLHAVMDRVEKGETAAQYKKDALGFEINELGRHFNRTLHALIEQRTAKEMLEQELLIGHEIQKNLFPKEIPQVSGIEVAAGFIPAREVAGDFYDLFLTGSNTLMIAIADASGKGISACLYSLLFRSLLRSQIQVQKDLSEALYQANLLFCQDTAETGNFATAWIGLYETTTKQLAYCNGGHLPPLLIRADGMIVELDHGMGAFGVEELLLRPSIRTVQLTKGDLLILITDGILEAENRIGKWFGKQALYDFVDRIKKKTPREVVDLLLQEVDHFSQGAIRSDDLTILSIRIN